MAPAPKQQVYVSCLVQGCKYGPGTAYQEVEKGINLHHFPTNDILMREWKQFVNLPVEDFVGRNMRVCSLHFADKWKRVRVKRGDYCTELTKGAVPTIYPEAQTEEDTTSAPAPILARVQKLKYVSSPSGKWRVGEKVQYTASPSGQWRELVMSPSGKRRVEEASSSEQTSGEHGGGAKRALSFVPDPHSSKPLHVQMLESLKDKYSTSKRRRVEAVPTQSPLRRRRTPSSSDEKSVLITAQKSPNRSSVRLTSRLSVPLPVGPPIIRPAVPLTARRPVLRTAAAVRARLPEPSTHRTLSSPSPSSVSVSSLRPSPKLAPESPGYQEHESGSDSNENSDIKPENDKTFKAGDKMNGDVSSQTDISHVTSHEAGSSTISPERRKNETEPRKNKFNRRQLKARCPTCFMILKKRGRGRPTHVCRWDSGYMCICCNLPFPSRQSRSSHESDHRKRQTYKGGQATCCKQWFMALEDRKSHECPQKRERTRVRLESEIPESASESRSVEESARRETSQKCRSDLQISTDENAMDTGETTENLKPGVENDGNRSLFRLNLGNKTLVFKEDPQKVPGKTLLPGRFVIKPTIKTTSTFNGQVIAAGVPKSPVRTSFEPDPQTTFEIPLSRPESFQEDHSITLPKTGPAYSDKDICQPVITHNKAATVNHRKMTDMMDSKFCCKICSKIFKTHEVAIAHVRSIHQFHAPKVAAGFVREIAVRKMVRETNVALTKWSKSARDAVKKRVPSTRKPSQTAQCGVVKNIIGPGIVQETVLSRSVAEGISNSTFGLVNRSDIETIGNSISQISDNVGVRLHPPKRCSAHNSANVGMEPCKRTKMTPAPIHNSYVLGSHFYRIKPTKSLVQTDFVEYECVLCSVTMATLYDMTGHLLSSHDIFLNELGYRGTKTKLGIVHVKIECADLKTSENERNTAVSPGNEVYDSWTSGDQMNTPMVLPTEQKYSEQYAYQAELKCDSDVKEVIPKEIKQEPVDYVDETEVKQEPVDETEVKQEPVDETEVKQEPVDETEVKQEPVVETELAMSVTSEQNTSPDILVKREECNDED